MDIVEWLRGFRASSADSNINAAVVNGKLDEAADEIERLQKVIINMTNMSNDIWNAGAIALWEDD
jgi:hypothetical protein